MLRSTWIVLKRRDRDAQLPAQRQGRRRQRPQHGALLGPARLPGEVPLLHELLEEAGVGGAIGELPAAAHAQA